MNKTIDVAKSILSDTAHRGMVTMPKTDAEAMARGYLAWVRIKDVVAEGIIIDLNATELQPTSEPNVCK